MRLIDKVRQARIVSHKEDTGTLAKALEDGGFEVQVWSDAEVVHELPYPNQSRTLLNHCRVWADVAGSDEEYVLICEADFVPVRNLGALPVFWPLDDAMAWGYLYQGSPRLLNIDGPYLRGHNSTLVCYVVTPLLCKTLLAFTAEVLERYGTDYFTFDSMLQWHVMGKGFRAYFPRKAYGEHGGLANPEHEAAGLPRAGTHRSDALAGPLAFLPQYAKGSRFAYLRERAYNRALGLARLLTNRWVVHTNVYEWTWRTKLHAYAIGLRRLLVL